MLVGLIVVVTAGSVVTSRSADASARSVRLAAAFNQAASAVAAEESLERKYRLQPGPVPKAAHTAAEVTLERAMGLVASLGDGADRRLSTTVVREHAEYVTASARLFESVDLREPVAVTNAIDSRFVDPVFAVIEAQVYVAAAAHQADALDSAQKVRRVGRLVVMLDLATLLVGVALVVAAILMVILFQRRLRAESDQNRHQALHDSLTGLPNRTLFQDRTGVALSAARRSGASVVVMLMDLDRFREVNDTLGHQYGDNLLLAVADRLAATLRDADSIARLGGDEFAVLLPVSGWDDAMTAAQRIGAALRTPFTVQDVTLEVEASIGIAVSQAGDDVDTLLRHADVAMYQSKAEHRPFVSYDSSRDDNSMARLVLLGDLRRAIETGELTLHYQPKIDAKTGILSSVEALVRWQHPTLGLVQPDDFIPIAETTAIVHALTTEVLSQALRQTRLWADRGSQIPVAVNISARCLLNPAFPHEVHALLDRCGVPAHLLTLELTETVIMTDRNLAHTVLRALDAMGVSISIDDFGTGYSSMSYLKSLPVRELKIDRSFVTGMTTDADNAVIVRSAVELGHNLGMSVVAEGVEDQAAREALSALGCDQLQGYQICRPVPATELEAWLTSHAPRRPEQTAISATTART